MQNPIESTYDSIEYLNRKCDMYENAVSNLKSVINALDAFDRSYAADSLVNIFNLMEQEHIEDVHELNRLNKIVRRN